MTSLYEQSIPPLIKYLGNLSALLTAGVKYAEEQGIPHEKFLNFRLAEDMRPFTFQVQAAANTSKFYISRLGVAEDVYFRDDETTFEQLQARLATTIELLRAVDERSMDGKEKEPVLMKTVIGDRRFESGQAYWSDYTVANVHFHIGTAYCILRHLGVPIGALDYLGRDTFVNI